MKLITAHVTIGKSKEVVNYLFLDRDFDRIENDRLYLKNDDRVLKIDEETKRQIVFQINHLHE
jgi:hypothetical protein